MIQKTRHWIFYLHLVAFLSIFAIGCGEDDNSAKQTPVLTTDTISAITYESAVCGGTISDDGGFPVTIRGVCWNTMQLPSVSDNNTTDGMGTGSFVSTLSGLDENTTYYVRAYATNIQGTSYGNEVVFTTTAAPVNSIVLSTNNVTNITHMSAACGGNITDDGGNPITARGICWSTNQTPSLADQVVNMGNGSGAFAGELSGFSVNTTYYVRAFASNSIGTKYGSQKQFTTLGEPEALFMADVDGVTFIPTDITIATFSDRFGISGYIGNESLLLWFPLNPTTGTHTLDMFADYMGQYKPTTSTIYTSAPGTITITEINATTGRIKGTFSFTGKVPGSSATVEVTNGVFDFYR